MKKSFFACLLLISLWQNLNAQIIPIYNWYHEGEKDWVTISGDQDMSSSGYINRTLVYKASTTSNPGMIAINRWYHQEEGDWATLPENYGTDASLIAAGYKFKHFLFYAYPNEMPGTIRVNLWYHPGDRDYVSLHIDYATDQNLIQWGYQKNNNGGFYAYPKNYEESNRINITAFNNVQALNYATLYTSAEFGGSHVNATQFGRKELSELRLASLRSIKVVWGYKAIIYYNVNKGGVISNAQMEVIGDRETLPEGVTHVELAAYTPLNGFVDMHTHPMSYLGFGKRLVHGAPDIGSIIPKGTRHKGFDLFKKECNDQDEIATSIEHALGNCAALHQEWAPDNDCGNAIRRFILHSFEEGNQARGVHGNTRGAPTFVDWPKWNDITHQQMWVDWIRRSQQNGLRVMVALAVNNKTLADAMQGDDPKDDRASADLQIEEIVKFVGRHNDFMEVAYNSSDLRRIVGSGRLAVVVGIEVDNIGNFNNEANLTHQMIVDEIDRLYGMGVRYVFPIHVLDNKFGGTAVYKSIFNYSNKRETGQFYQMECGQLNGNVNYYFSDDVKVQLGGLLLGQDPFREADTPHECYGLGHVNQKSLTENGEYAINELMRRGMLIDIDHMSQKSANRTIEIAKGAINNNSPLSYPLNSGHNGLRSDGGDENSRTLAQVSEISRLGGLFGVGSDGVKAPDYLRNFDSVWRAMGNKATAMGTDVNGFAKLPKPTPGSSVTYGADFPQCQTSTARWDYNVVGVAHFGLIPDFIRDIRTINLDREGGGIINGNSAMNELFKSAEYFAQMWEKCEREKVKVRN